MDNLPLFVYGTLRPGSKKYSLLRYAVEPGRTLTAELPSYQMYSIGRFPGIVSDDRAVKPVQGDLLWIDTLRYAQTLDRLDRYEGEGYTFHRIAVTVFAKLTRHQESAWVYVVNPKVLRIDFSNKIESNDWFQVAYRD